MIPIISHGLAGERSYNYSEFEKHFLKICEDHREERRALAFAFILHDLRSPQISKALRDEDYWKALNEISGEYLSVFSFHREQPRPTRRKRRRSKSDYMNYMTVISAEEFEDGRSILERYFELEHNIKLPAILFFQVSNAEIIGSRIVQLTNPTIEGSFLEIKEIISTAAYAVSQVTKENYRNDYVIFQLIEDDLSDRGIRVIMSAVIKKAKSIKELLSLFRGYFV